MTDKVQKIREEVERIQLYTQSEVLKKVLDYIDEVQKEPVSEELETEIQRYYIDWDEHPEYVQTARHFANWQKQRDQSTIELAEDHAMLAGMEKMKEEMMANAIDVEVKVDAGGYPYIDRTIELYDYDKDEPLAKEGDKYKVVLIKEE